MEKRALNFEAALTFMFREEGWVSKYLIGFLMLLFFWLLLPFIILMGYIIAIARRSSRDQQPTLPPWEAWGELITDGFLYLFAVFAYTLPIYVLFACAVIGIGAIDTFSTPTGDLTPIGLALWCLWLIVAFLFGLVSMIFLNVAVVNFVRKGTFRSFFEFGELYRDFRDNLGRYGIVILILAGASMLGSFLPFIGTVWSQYAVGHLYGQLAAPPMHPTESPVERFPPEGV